MIICTLSSFDFYSHHFLDEIVFSDAEAKNSENGSDDGATEFMTATESGTSEPVVAASESAITEQVHDTEDFGKLPYLILVSVDVYFTSHMLTAKTVLTVTSTVNEAVPDSEGKAGLIIELLYIRYKKFMEAM